MDTYQECSNLFATGGGERLAEEIACPFLGMLVGGKEGFKGKKDSAGDGRAGSALPPSSLPSQLSPSISASASPSLYIHLSISVSASFYIRLSPSLHPLPPSPPSPWISSRADKTPTLMSFHFPPLPLRRYPSTLGRIPIDPQLGTAVGEGTNYLEAFAGSGTYDAVMQIVAPLHALAAGDAERAAGEEADGEAA